MDDLNIPYYSTGCHTLHTSHKFPCNIMYNWWLTTPKVLSQWLPIWTENFFTARKSVHPVPTKACLYTCFYPLGKPTHLSWYHPFWRRNYLPRILLVVRAHCKLEPCIRIYCTVPRLYAVLKTWGVLHWGWSLRWLCNIVKVSKCVEPRHCAITNLDNGVIENQPMKSLLLHFIHSCNLATH